MEMKGVFEMNVNGFITPIQVLSLDQIREEQNLGQIAGNSEGTFKDIFTNAINDVREKESDLQHKQYLLATGQIDDAHTVPIAMAEAKLSVDMLVQLRNKSLEAYNELMRISL